MLSSRLPCSQGASILKIDHTDSSDIFLTSNIKFDVKGQGQDHQFSNPSEIFR